MGSFPPCPAGPGWGGGQILIGCCVLLWSHPQQMFFFGRFHWPVYFKLLHHSLEVKGLRMESVVRSEGVGVELMREKQGVMYSCLFSQSHSSELKFNPSFQNLHFNPCRSQKCTHIFGSRSGEDIIEAEWESSLKRSLKFSSSSCLQGFSFMLPYMLSQAPTHKLTQNCAIVTSK